MGSNAFRRCDAGSGRLVGVLLGAPAAVVAGVGIALVLGVGAPRGPDIAADSTAGEADSAEVVRLQAKVADLESEIERLVDLVLSDDWGDTPADGAEDDAVGALVSSARAGDDDEEDGDEDLAADVIELDVDPGVRARLAALLERLPVASLAEHPGFWSALIDELIEAGDHDLAIAGLRTMVAAGFVAPEGTVEWLAQLPIELRLSELRRFAGPSENDELWGDLGDALVEAGDGGAVDAFLRALALDPADEEWVNQVGESDPLRGLAIIEAALEEMPNDAELLASLANLHRAAGSPGAAFEAYERAFRETEGGDWADALVAIDPGRAATLFREALERDAERADLWQPLAVAHGLSGNPQAAIEAVGEAIAAGHDPTGTYEALVLHDPSSAIPVIETVLGEQPENDELWGDLGDAYFALGRPQEALDRYRRAHELDEEDEEWSDAIAMLTGESVPMDEMDEVLIFDGDEELIELDRKDVMRMLGRRGR